MLGRNELIELTDEAAKPPQFVRHGGRMSKPNSRSKCETCRNQGGEVTFEQNWRSCLYLLSSLNSYSRGQGNEGTAVLVR